MGKSGVVRKDRFLPCLVFFHSFIHSVHSFIQWSSHSRNAHSAFSHGPAVNHTGRASANRGLTFQWKGGREADHRFLIDSFIRGHLSFRWTQLHGKKRRTWGNICWRPYHVLGGSCPVWRVILWVQLERAAAISQGEESGSQTAFASGEEEWMWQKPALICSESSRKELSFGFRENSLETVQILDLVQGVLRIPLQRQVWGRALWSRALGFLLGEATPARFPSSAIRMDVTRQLEFQRVATLISFKIHRSWILHCVFLRSIWFFFQNIFHFYLLWSISSCHSRKCDTRIRQLSRLFLSGKVWNRITSPRVLSVQHFLALFFHLFLVLWRKKKVNNNSFTLKNNVIIWSLLCSAPIPVGFSGWWTTHTSLGKLGFLSWLIRLGIL